MEVRGLFGLAVIGPQSGCRITRAVKKAVVHDVILAVECTDEAVKNWEKGIWDD